jgi:hypothetical protein
MDFKENNECSHYVQANLSVADLPPPTASMRKSGSHFIGADKMCQSQSVVFTLSLRRGCATPRTTTPPSGVSVRTESRRTRFNCGAIRFRQLTESASLFESVSILVKGGWKETRGVQRPISAEKPVSESRMAPLNPFETKRKKAPSGASSRVCDVQVAERLGCEPRGRVLPTEPNCPPLNLSIQHL